MGRRLYVETVPVRFGAAMHCEMLWCGNGLEVVMVGPLQAFDEGNSKATSEIGVFAVGFLSAAPARIAEDIDVRRPNGESVVHGVDILTYCLVVLGTRFGRDDVGNSADQICVPRR